MRSCAQHSIGKYVSYEGFSLKYRAFLLVLDEIHIPKDVYEALSQPKWKAVFEEIRALENNSTWTLKDLPTGKRTVGCKWILSIKHNANGSISRFKARLVA